MVRHPRRGDRAGRFAGVREPRDGTQCGRPRSTLARGDRRARARRGLGVRCGRARDVSVELVAGRFRVVRIVGAGGTATVYEAVDERTQQVVALKVLHPHFADDERTWDAFFEEVRASSAIDHPAMVEVVDWGVHQGGGAPSAWIAMEFVPGSTLGQHVRRWGPLARSDALIVADALLRVIEASHDAGIVHRDISPSNVMVEMQFGAAGVRPGSVRLLDFGLADLSGRSTHGADPLLSAAGGGVVANVPYASPEHLTGRSVVEASDVYQVAAVLWFALTGAPPFTGDSEAVSLAHRTSPAPRLRDVLAGIDPALDRAIARALAKDPASRPSARDMRAALLRAGAAETPGDPSPARTANGWQEAVGTTALLPAAVAVSQRSRAGAVRWRRPGGVAVIVVGVLVAGAVIVGLSAAATPTTWDAGPAPTASSAEPTTSAAPSPAAPTIVVPELVGLSRADAEAALVRAGLRVGRVESVDAAASADTVVTASATRGVRLAAGSAVDLAVASGRNAVPDVTGLDADTAGARLTAAGFPSAVVGGVPGQPVISYSPTGSVPLGTAVALTLASAPSPTPTPPGSATPSMTPTPSPTPTGTPTPTP
ncbi:MAG: hypothetical protein CMH36_10265 [Microbacterium sp.]|nr:hypothetical protein [Microbacterium sp.]